MIDLKKLYRTKKNNLYGNKITTLIDRLPRLRCRVRYAHTATQTPRKKMANVIILPLPTRRLKQDFLYIFATYEKRIDK